MKDCFISKQPTFFVKLCLVFSLSLAFQLGYGQTIVDCNLSANCNNAQCAAQEKGCKCADGIDNDGDGKIDKADSNCATYYGLTFVGDGSDCSITPPSGNDPFDLINAPITSQQNTSDTQSKISVGDVDGDGVPDAVITSKWNSEMRVVATREPQADGTKAGAVKSSFNLSGNAANVMFSDIPNSGACAPSRLLFEHENLIADIDKDGKAELFGVVSNRAGNPETPPTCFYLVGFSYATGSLNALWKAVSVGTDRPGAIGVADMDGDGKAEIYLRDRIYAAETGKLIAQAGGNWDSDVAAATVAVNITGDSKMELVTGSRIYSIPSLTDRTGATVGSLTLIPDGDMNAFSTDKYYVKLMTDPVEYGTDTHSSVSVADLDKDGFVDVVLTGALNSTSGNTCVFYWNYAKKRVTSFVPPDATDLAGWSWGTGRVNIGDADGDGYPNLSFIAGNRLWCLKIDTSTGVLSNQWASYRTINDSRSGVLTVTIYDFDNDGKPELVYRDSQILAVIDGATGVGTEWSAVCQSHTYTEGPIIADVNGDGGTDICVPCYTSSVAGTVSSVNIDNAGSGYTTASVTFTGGGGTGATADVTLQSGKIKSIKITNSGTGYSSAPTVVITGNGTGASATATISTGSFSVNDGLQQQALGQFRLYYSAANDWLPTRKVWNQQGYFVVNIKDNLQLPFPQLDQNLVFGTGNCPNGLPGPQMPMNVFMNQVPYLSANGCPVFPAPDLTYYGDNPDNPNVDVNGDGVYTPTVEVIPPICGDLAIKARFNITNSGDLPISTNIPVSFFKADPTLATTTAADLLLSTTISVANLAVDAIYQTPYVTFNGTGGTFRLYIVLNNNGLTLPINPNASSSTECRLDNNIYSLNITPDPFTTTAETLTDNLKCGATGANTGSVRARIYKAGVEQTDYSPYAFQWYSGPTTAPVAIAGATNYNMTGLAAGTYSVRVTNTQKGCVGVYVQTVVVLNSIDPNVTIVATDQTKCSPPDGTLTATITDPGGNTGFTFKWYDVGLNYLGIQGSVATNMAAGNYKLVVEKSGCTKQVDAPPIGAPPIPDAQASVLQNVVDCLNPNSGSIKAEAYFNLALQDPANYTFDWYYYNNGTSTKGSILPVQYGTGQTRTGLPVGYYQVEVKDNATGCKANTLPIVQITSQTVVPTAQITQVAPQTSCDPNQPNGILTATGIGTGLTSPNDFTFQWFKGDNTILPALTTVTGAKGETVNQVAGGGVYYTVKVTTANNCSATAKFIIAEDVVQPIITLAPTPNSICDAANATSNYNGAVTATVTFKGSSVTLPNSNYNFTWYNGATTADPTITVADKTLATLPNLNGGSYTAIVERLDLHCKSNPDTKTVLNTQVFPVITTVPTGSTNCPGGTPNGSVAVTNVTPADTYKYRWFDPTVTLIAGETTNTLSGKQGGTGQNYTVEVTLASTGCKSTVSTNIPDNKVLPVLTLTPTDNSICDPALTYNGSIATNVNDVNFKAGQTYTFAWATGNNMTSIIAGQTASSLTQRNGGFYTATVTNNQLNCTSSPVTTEIKNNQILPALSATPKPSTNCPGGTDNGGATVTVTNAGLNTFTYQWYKGNLITDPIVPIANGGNTVTISGQAGNNNYTVQARNSQTGCTNTFIQFVPDNSVVPVLTLSSSPNSICDPALGYNGSITQTGLTDVNTLAGDTYTYTWSTGNTMASPIAGQTSSTLTGQNGGTYSATVKNNRLNCTSNIVTIDILNAQILPALSGTATPATNCPGGTDNGAANVNVTNAGTNTFTYNWFKGNLVTDPAVPNGNGGNTSNITAQAGNQNYIVRVKNNQTGCTNTLVQTIADNSVVPVLTVTPSPNSICLASLGYNGGATKNTLTDVNALGSDTYTYVWSVGNTMASPIAAQSTSTLTGQNGGTYSVTVKNNRLNCTSNIITFTIVNAQILPALTPTPTPATNCPSGTNNGSATVAITNAGTNTYTFQWYKGTLVTDPTVAPGNGGTTNTITAQQGGQNYLVEVSNNQTGCKNTASTTIADNSIVPVLTLNSSPNSICNAALGYNGSATKNTLADPNALGGDTYTYVWSTGNTMASPIGGASTSTLSGRNGGFYTATVKNDRLGCTSNPVTVEILNAKVLPVLTITPTPSTNCVGGQANGQIGVAVDPTGHGTNTFAYQWYTGNSATAGSEVPTAPNGGNTATIIQMQGGANYTIQVTVNQTGCQTTTVQALADISANPSFALTPASNSKCVAPFNGSTTIGTLTDANAIPASDTYEIKWYSGQTTAGTLLQTDATVAYGVMNGTALSTLDNGFYTVTIRNKRLNCTSGAVTAEVLDALVIPTITTTVTNSTNCTGGTANGYANVTSVAPADSYLYKWYSGAGVGAAGTEINSGTNDTDISGQQGSATAQFTIEVTRTTTGCTATKTVSILDDSKLPVITALTFAPNQNCSAPFNGTAAFNGATPFTYRSNTITTPFTGFNIVWTKVGGGTFTTAGDNRGISALSAGTYEVVVTAGAGNTITNNNDNCVSAPATATIVDDLTNPTVTISKVDQTSCDAGAPNGSLTANVTGGNAGHTFKWYNGIGTLVGNDITEATTNIITSKASGDYTSYVQNTTTRCETTTTFFLPDNVVNPVVTLSTLTDVTTCVPPNGSARAVISNISPMPNTNFTVYYAKTFSAPSLPATPPSTTAAIIAQANADGTKVTSTSTPASGTNPPDILNLNPGFLSAVVVDNYTTCVSSPVVTQLEDLTALNNINVGVIAAAGLCGGGGGGSIQTTVSGGSNPGTYTFKWYMGTPSNNNINFFTNPPNMTSAGPVIATTEDLNEDLVNPPVGVNAGTYTLVVTDPAGCGNYEITSVPFADRPTITITETDPINCTSPNGKIDVVLTNALFGPYSVVVYSGNTIGATTNSIVGEVVDNGFDDDVDGQLNLLDADYNDLTVSTNSNLTAGQYIVRVIDYTPANRNCPIDQGVVLEQKAFAPVATAIVLTPNTACDDTNNADGSVRITVEEADTDPRDPTLVVGYGYEITNITPAPVNPPAYNVTIGAANTASITTDLAYGFGPTTYTINVREKASQCATTAVVTIPDQPKVPQIIDVTVTDDSFCAPNSNGKAVVTNINPVAITDYKYTWYSDVALTTTLYSGNGTGTLTGGEVFRAANTGTYIKGTAGNGIPVNTVYVRGERLPGTGDGVGCPTPAVKVIIQDVHKTVVPILSSSPNTSCTPGIGEGSISVTSSTAAPTGAELALGYVDVSGATYSYTLDGGAADNGKTGTTPWTYSNLVDKGGVDYIVTATNETSGCTSTNTIKVLPTKYSLAIISNTAKDQLICNPDGDIQITQVNIDRTLTGNGTQSFMTATLNADFDFTWYRAADATPGVIPGTPLAEPAGVGGSNITTSLLTGNLAVTDGEYNSMKYGTYYVTATRKSAAGGTLPVVGLGCSTPAYRVDLTDKHINPVVSLKAFSNTACAATFEGAIDVTVTDATVYGSLNPNPGVAKSYAYSWVTATGTAIGPVASNDGDASNADGDGDQPSALKEGDYTLTATNNQTGCVATGNTTIFKNVTPIFVTNMKIVPQLYCDPSGSITVTAIQYKDRNGALQSAPVADFDFAWTKIGSGAVGGITSALDSTTYASIGFAQYQVSATRARNGPGNGCTAAPVNAEILDARKFPAITMTPFSNTSCTTAFEGAMEVRVTDASSAKKPPVAFNYQYSWVSTGSAIGVTTGNNGNGTNDGDNDRFTLLQDGQYTLTVKNNVTNCTNTQVSNIIKNQTPVFIQAVDTSPQFYCTPGGNLEVKTVKWNDINGAPQTGPLNNFTYTWSRGTLGAGTVVTDPTLAQPAGHIGTELDSIVSPSIGADTYYVVATRKIGTPGAGCSSAPYKIEIADKHQNPNVVMTPFSNTSCTTAFEGEITMNVTDASAAKVPPVAFSYNYTWTSVVTAIANSTNNNGNAVNDGGGPDRDRISSLQEGTYAVTVTNPVTGCSSTAQTTIVKNQTPVFLTVVNPTPQFYCDPSGNLRITGVTFKDRTGATQVGALADFKFTWSRTTVGNVVATTFGNTARGAYLDSLAYPAIGFDPDYYVVATRQSGSPGAGCASAPTKIEIADKRVKPAIVLTPFSNTSCTTAFEGEITVKVTDASVAKKAPAAGAGVPFTWDYTWTGPTAIANSTGNNGNNVNDGSGPDKDRNINLQDGAYTLSVKNPITGCTNTAATTVIKNATPVFVQNVKTVPQMYCFASGNLNVKAVTFNDRTGATQNGPLGDFTYTWSRNTIGSTVATTGSGITPPAGHTGTELDSIVYNTIGTGTYYVVATRKVGTPGAGCSSAPFKVDIGDKRESPTVGFTTVANTSCDNNFDGRITVLSSNKTAPSLGSNYDILWTSIATGSTVSNVTNVGGSYTTPLTDIIGPGTYTAQVTNRTTQCVASNVVTMVSNPQPIEILTVSTTDQLICYPDGSITVQSLTTGTPVNYSFNWFRNTSNSTALVDAGNSPIIVGNISKTNYPTMGGGTYFVVARKLAAQAPGSGCVTPPFRVDIKDLHVDPLVALTYTPNTSCDPVNPNGTVVAVSKEQNGSIVDTYSFAWTLNSGPLNAATLASKPDNHTGRLDNAEDGLYVVTATNTSNTGCKVQGSITVKKDLNISTPNIIDVATIDPVNCKPTASAEVTRISIGGIVFYNFPPDNLDNTFDYEWYKGSYAPANQLAGQVNHNILNITPDKYYVTVKDLTTACKSTPKEVVIKDDKIIYPVIEITQTELQVSCIATTGTAELQATADGDNDTNPNYAFTWFRNLNATPPSFLTGSTVASLVAGDYSVSVLNIATGCSSQALYIVPDNAPTFYPQLSLSSDPRISCIAPDGTVLAREVGYDPNSPYPFLPNYSTEIYTGAGANTTIPGTPMPVVSGFNRNWLTTGLDVGVYTVKITDNNTGCVVTGEQEVKDKRTPPIVVVIQDNPLINCDPLRPNGQLSATADNGLVQGYTFDWYKGATVTGAIVQTNNKLIGQTVGDYTVRVTNDFTGCNADKSGTITDGHIDPPVPTAEVIQHRTHCVYPDGWVAANVNGETVPYSFDWYDGSTKSGSPDFNGVNYNRRDVGFYTVTAMEIATGCYSQPTTVEVLNQQIIPTLTFTTTPSYCEDVPTDDGQGTGMIEMTLNPANAQTDSVVWTKIDDGTIAGVGGYITGVWPGFYRADVLTDKGCPATGEAEVKTEIKAYNLVTKNNDNKNDAFVIDCISRFKNNTVKIYNRAGILVYEAHGYDNLEKVFKGLGEMGLYTTGNELPVGTYFYIIDKGEETFDGQRVKTGYLELVR